MTGDLIGITEAAKIAHVHENTVRGWADSGLLDVAEKRGIMGYRTFRRADVLAVAAARSREAAQARERRVSRAAARKDRYTVQKIYVIICKTCNEDITRPESGEDVTSRLEAAQAIRDHERIYH